MKIFAIGDLHLPGGDNKPMNIFGDQWEGHFEKISADWQEKVSPEDVVLIPGDISWAMQMDNALPDLNMIGALKGRKIILKGNHDYWWNSISRLRDVLPEGMIALQNDAVQLDGVLFCGSRGWTTPAAQTDDEDAKIYKRELMRMEMSLKCARKLNAQAPLIAMTHYPPLAENGDSTPMTALFEEYRVDTVVYGHLHGPALHMAVNGCLRGVNYCCVSCDGLGFSLREIKVENESEND